MGLTGIVPMTHAALTFGIDQANRQMGWYWYIREAMWYVGGAVIYMVSRPLHRVSRDSLICIRPRSLNALPQEDLTSGEARIRYFMSVSFWELRRI